MNRFCGTVDQRKVLFPETIVTVRDSYKSQIFDTSVGFVEWSCAVNKLNHIFFQTITMIAPSNQNYHSFVMKKLFCRSAYIYFHFTF